MSAQVKQVQRGMVSTLSQAKRWTCINIVQYSYCPETKLCSFNTRPILWVVYSYAGLRTLQDEMEEIDNSFLKSSCNYSILLDFKKIIPLNCWSQMWKIVVKDPQIKCADLSCNCMSWFCLLTNLIEVKRLESKDFSSAIWYRKIKLIHSQLALRVSMKFNF